MSAPTEYRHNVDLRFLGSSDVATQRSEPLQASSNVLSTHYRVWSNDLNLEDASTARTIVASDLIPQRSIAESRRTEKLPPKLSPMQRLLLEDTNMVVFRVRSSK